MYLYSFVCLCAAIVGAASVLILVTGLGRRLFGNGRCPTCRSWNYEMKTETKVVLRRMPHCSLVRKKRWIACTDCDHLQTLFSPYRNATPAEVDAELKRLRKERASKAPTD